MSKSSAFLTVSAYSKWPTVTVKNHKHHSIANAVHIRSYNVNLQKNDAGPVDLTRDRESAYQTEAHPAELAGPNICHDMTVRHY